jgi:hypothetical protein
VWLVIADTGPVNYLVLIGEIDLPPRMFEKIALPLAVQAELADPPAPLPVRRWIATPPHGLKSTTLPACLKRRASMKEKRLLSRWLCPVVQPHYALMCDASNGILSEINRLGPCGNMHLRA